MDPALVDPTESSPAAAFTPAPRTVRDLRGKTVGLLVNTKYNSDTLLNCLGALLQERHGVRELVRESKPYFARPLPDELAASLAARCDVVVTAIGD